jgi:hypothetical protein
MRASRLVGVLRGIRTAIGVFLTDDTRHQPPAQATGST